MSDAARKEARRRYYTRDGYAFNSDRDTWTDGFEDGAEWQAEQPVEITDAIDRLDALQAQVDAVCTVVAEWDGRSRETDDMILDLEQALGGEEQ